jgi:hypothetical protein
VHELNDRHVLHGAWPLGWTANSRSVYAYDMYAATVLQVPLDGSQPTRLTDLSAHRVALVPAISPDARYVVFSAHAIHADVWLAEDFDAEDR